MNRCLVLVVSFSVCCCNSLLGIEEAKVDPLLEASRSEAELDSGAAKSPTSRPEPSSTPEVQPSTSEPASSSPIAETPGKDLSDDDDDVQDDDDADVNDDDVDDDDVDDDDADDDDADDDDADDDADDDDADDDDVDDDDADDDDVDDDNVDDDDADDDSADVQSMCDKYCEEVMEQCVGEMQQYRDLRQCLTVCELLPEGDLASGENENTVACRLRYASDARYAAGTEQAAYCRQAGPGGDGRCGSNCEGYCTLMMQVCTPQVTSIYRYKNSKECAEACEALPLSDVPYSSASVAVADGNHVQCRLFHVTSAAMLDAEEHCEHAVGITLCEAPEDETE